MTLKKGTKTAHKWQVMWSLLCWLHNWMRTFQRGLLEILQKATYPRTLLINMVIDSRNLLKIWISVVLSCGMNSNSSQVETFCLEYQYLFAMNLSELGKTSLVQHDIKLDNPTLFKEHYCRFPHINMIKLRNIFRK